MAAVKNLKKKKKKKKLPRRAAPNAKYQPGHVLTLREVGAYNRYPHGKQEYTIYYVIVFLDVWKVKVTHYSTLIFCQNWYNREWHYYFDVRSENQLKKHFMDRPNVEVVEKDLKFLVLYGSPLTMVQDFLKNKVDIRLEKELAHAQKTLNEATDRIQLIDNVKGILLEESNDRADSQSTQ